MTDFTDAVARLENLDNSLFLGRICWYAITETSYINHELFCQELLRREFSAALPPVPRSSDVFKRACTASQKNRVPVDDGFVNILVREVGKNAQFIWRTIVAEKIDTEGHRLDYTECIALTYDRQAQTIVTEVLNPLGESQAVQAVEQEIKDLYAAWFNVLTPYAVREHIRRLIRGLGASVLRDGVYFVPEEHSARVDALEEIVAIVGGGSLFHSLPLVDDRKQRQMLRAAFEADSVGEIDRLVGEIGEILRTDRKISSDRFADFKVEYDRLRGRVGDYSELLDEAMDASGSRLEVMDQLLFQLMGRIKV